MKKLFLFFLIIFIAGSTNSFAQFSRYIIQLKDKTGSPFFINNPTQFLTQRSIDRRKRYNISIDESDLPVTPAYIDSIRLSGNVTILNVSKWFNQVCVQTTDTAALNKINSFSFVKAASPIAARMVNELQPVNKQLDPPYNPLPLYVTGKPQGPTDYYNYGQSFPQVHLHNTEFLHNHGFRGEGMQLAIMDAGFYHYLSLPTFDSVINNNQILGTWDFVANEASVNEDYAHGMNCLSTIAANMPGLFVGTAPKTSFYLYRTEDISSEYPVEEQNWAAAAERADSLGVDVFSVSLGYTTFDNSLFNYTYANMDGNTTLIARAADMAANKGIMVVVANGNEGNSNWHYITTPADADSILAVGAVDVNRQVASFSSYGPASNGQTKPDVAAVGADAIVANQSTGNPSYNNGTSFSCPIMAGITTCLWQAFPEVNNMDIIGALRKSSDRFTTPDNRTGYGIPDAKKAFVLLIKKLYTQAISINNNCTTDIKFTVKAAADMNLIIERKLPADADYTTISTQHSFSGFANTNFTYTDDLNGLPGNIAIKYRIKMTIASDTSFYVDSAIVNFAQPCASSTITEKIVISPNPAADKLTVLIAKNNAVKAGIEIYSVSGQKVYSINNQAVSRSQTFLIPMKQFSPGIYLVSVFIDNKKTVTKKIIRN
jgi:serine protease AprX